MVSSGLSGLTTVVIAGAVTGSVLAPMKLMKGWRFENIWLIYSIGAYAIAPWAVALFTVPNLFTVYRMVPTEILVFTFLLGMGFGLAVVLSGVAVDLVGLSISTALLYGSSVALGSIGAMVMVEPSRLLTSRGMEVVAWDLILVVGVLFCAQAGRVRDPAASSSGARTRRGVVVSLLAGVLSTLFNIVLTYGEPIRQQAIALGANPRLASNAIWALAVSGGSLPSIVWSLRLLSRQQTWGLYRQPGTRWNSSICIGMGIAWIAGTVLYSVGVSRIGRFGTTLAWPIYMSAIILTGIAWGLVLREWRGAPSRAIRYLWMGVGTQVVAIALLSFSK